MFRGFVFGVPAFHNFFALHGVHCSIFQRDDNHTLESRAVDQDGDVLDILVQKRRDKRAAKRFFQKLLKGLCTCRE